MVTHPVLWLAFSLARLFVGSPFRWLAFSLARLFVGPPFRWPAFSLVPVRLPLCVEVEMNPRSNVPKASRAKRATAAREPESPSREDVRFPIVGIGASAGGLEAFSALLRHLPTDTGLGLVLVQHLDPGHESALPQILARETAMPVLEVTHNLRVEPNHVYVIPPNRHLEITRGVLKLEPRAPKTGVARSIDFFFEALAKDQRECAIGVVLSGTASDGTVGLEFIKTNGGITFAQDGSARYDSMPRSAVAAGCVDFVLSPADIARELTRIARHPYLTESRPESVSSPEADRSEAVVHQDDAMALPSDAHAPQTGALQARIAAASSPETGGMADGYRNILIQLHKHAGVDFSLYKSSTIQRRIARRMVLSKQNTLDEYAIFLRGSATELAALYSDVLINVTSFFRNPEAFEILTSRIFPELLAQRSDDPVRVWVLGCSTGQEAYSIVMAFMEASEKAPRERGLQVFATDLNEAHLAKARLGVYAKSLAQDISPERLRRFFTEEQGGYRVSKGVRDIVVFARQNLIADPPFSRMDLVSCRNVLIYLEPSLQKRAIRTFHYSLNPGGFLLLGASESIAGFTELFEPADKKLKIYVKKATHVGLLPLPLSQNSREQTEPSERPSRASLALGRGRNAPPETLQTEHSAQREADRVTVQRFAPPGVLIDDDLQILQFRGATGAYLEPPRGKASFDVLQMARQGLMLPLRVAIHEAKKDNQIARKENVQIGQNGTPRAVNVEVIPLKNLRERCFLILFEDAQDAEPTVALASAGERPAGQEEVGRLVELERELAETRYFIQFMQEQHEAASEELQASNEEGQSANEELQSVNEELETSKEELQSANEELTTVNDEMAHRNVELHRLNGDLINLQTSAQLAIVLLARDLTVRHFSPLAEKRFHLLPGDVGRPLGNIRHDLAFVSGGTHSPHDLESFISDVITTVRPAERDVRDDRDGRWFSLRAHPYFTIDNKVDGAVLVLVDIDLLKRSEQEIKHKEEALRLVHAELQVHTEELTRFNDVVVGRELRMIELKQEINALCKRLGEGERYPLEFEKDGRETPKS